VNYCFYCKYQKVIVSYTLMRPLTLMLLLLTLLPRTGLRAVLFYDTGVAGHNTSAPSGALADSGWQWQGYFGSYLGTMISPQHFITAQHFGVASTTFVHDALFSGGASTTYTINAAANGGLGYWDIAGTDLRVYQVDGVFGSYAPLYTGSNEVGMDLVVFGRGGPRGVEVLVDSGSGPESKGWRAGSADGVARWGENEVSSIETASVGEVLAVEFNALPGINEAHLSVGDSGGAVFIQDGGVWKLAGINYAVDGAYDTNNTTGDGLEFSGALFDQGGLWAGSDGGGWTFLPNDLVDNPGRFYASRISSSAGAIQAITAVPEPAGILLLGPVLLVRRRRRVEMPA
jgi:hypothetical protein